MIRVLNISKAYGSNLLFDEVSFVLNPGERLGLVGRNGHGKTTLFRILLGSEAPDDGQMVVSKGYRIGHLSQQIKFSEPSVLAEACTGLPETEDGTDTSYRAKAALDGLGFSQEDLDRSPEELSGGFQVRLNLAKVLISEPNLLLLDEPTNYLDIVSMRWLQRFLGDWRRELILITQDREFMDGVTTHTMAIHRKKLRKIEGTTVQAFELIAQQEEIHEKTRLNQEKNRRQQEQFIERFRAKATKAKAVQSRVKRLDKELALERLDEIHDLNFRFRAASFPAKRTLNIEGLSFNYPEGPQLIEELGLQVGRHDRIGVIGPNGRGKTTLLSLLSGVLEPGAGKIGLHPKTEMAYFGQSNVDRLDPEKTVEEEILSVHPEQSRGAARGICGLMMFPGDDALKKVAVLSGGERSRVLLGKLLVSPSNLLVLDEPTNHLDMQSTEGLMHALEDFPGAIVLVTHSEMILSRVVNRLVVFDAGKVQVFEGGYQDFLEQIGWADEHFQKPSPTRSLRKGRNRKELRRLRSDIISERSKSLKPLEVKIKEVGKRMLVLEEEDRQGNALLCTASTDGDSEAIARLVRRARVIKTEVGGVAKQLEKLTHQQGQLEEDFARRLEELK